MNIDHVRVLAECAEELPPIIVHRETMRVVDGVHRLHAARMIGRKTIRVQFFTGDAAAAFVVAVHSNVQHGMPLSLAERTLAGSRIVRSHPQWSDRKIASVAGLSPKTVGAIRARSCVDVDQPDFRIGRDGRVRKVGRVDARGAEREAGPDPATAGTASRELEASAGVVAGSTVESAGAPEHRGSRQRGATIAPAEREGVRRTRNDRLAISPVDVVGRLRRDPSLRFTEGGRLLLRLLDTCAVDERRWSQILQSMPAHHAATVVMLAKECATSWWIFADRLTRQADSSDLEPLAGEGDVAG